MNGPILYAVFAVLIIIAGAAAYYFGTKSGEKKSEKKLEASKQTSKDIIKNAEREAQSIIKNARLEAKEERFKQKAEAEKEFNQTRKELMEMEKKLEKRSTTIEKRLDMITNKEENIERKEQSIEDKKRHLDKKEEDVKKLVDEATANLEKIAKMSRDEAKETLIDSMRNKAKHEASQLIKDIKENAKKNAKKEAREIVTLAIQRCAADEAIESTVSVVNLPDDDIKGRIIGREGRNIRAFEMETGIDLIIDDTPGAVVLSGYDPIRREIARIALERLIIDGRIHPSRIEEQVKKSQKEIEDQIEEAGTNMAFELGIPGIHPELLKLLGRLKYRTSYGQNVLQHSKEVSILTGIMAAELGFDAMLAKRAGLLHDIGKAIDFETEGTHTQLGYQIAKKYGEKEVVLNAIASHHEDAPATSLISVLVQAADTISGARPGARRETIESYIKRLQKLEAVANEFDGVDKSYAIQAGREVRVLVLPEDIDDYQADDLADNIAEKIQAELEYPGQIKITVIREKRAISYAK